MTATLRLAVVLSLALSALACGPDDSCGDVNAQSADMPSGLHYDFAQGSSAWWVAFKVSNTGDRPILFVRFLKADGSWQNLGQNGLRGETGLFYIYPMGLGERFTLRVIADDFSFVEEEVTVQDGGTFIGSEKWRPREP